MYKRFFIFCGNEKLHENWAKKYKKVVCITSSPEILCQKCIEFDNKFAFQIKGNISSNVDAILYEKLIDTYYKYSKLLFFDKKKEKIKYGHFCAKSLEYLNSDDFNEDFEEDENENSEENNSPLIAFSSVFKKLKQINKEFFEIIIRIMKHLILISQWFDGYPFLFHTLSFQEVKDLLEKKISKDFLYANILQNIYLLSYELWDKLLKGENIFEEKNKLKELQILLIDSLSFYYNFSNIDFAFIGNYYHIVNYFRDVDFCLKIYLFINFSFINTENHNFINELSFYLTTCEKRFIHWGFTCDNYLNSLNKSNYFNEESQSIINDTLKIKDFIVLGDKSFHEKIKTIEKNIKSNSFKYLNIEQISDYLNSKRKKRVYKLFLIFTF